MTPEDQERLPVRLYRSGRVGPRPDGGLAVAFGEPVALAEAAGSFSRISVLVNDPAYIHHYFHFMEILLALWGACRAFLPEATVERIVFTSANWSNPRQHDIQRHLLAALYPEAALLAPGTLQSETWDNVILIDRSLAVSSINKFLEPALPAALAWSDTLVEKVCRHLNIPLRRAGTAAAPRALYVRRQPPRRLGEELETALLDRLRRAGLQVNEVDYAALSWHEQIRTTAAHDLLIGVHGNGLTNLLWLPVGAGVLEIFPAGAHHYDYQLLAELRRFRYFGIEGREGGYIFRDFSRHGDAFGHGLDNNKEITGLSWSAVDHFIDLVSRPPLPR